MVESDKNFDALAAAEEEKVEYELRCWKWEGVGEICKNENI